MRRLCVVLCAAVVLPGQAPPKPDQKKSDIIETFKFVLVPVTVTNAGGELVSGLTPYDFRLFDNGKPQKITQDVASHPLSVVVAIQANSAAEKILPQIQKLGSVFESLLLGEDGEMAVLAFDHRILPLTEFTADSVQIDAAFKKLKPGSGTSALNDAAMKGITLLKSRPLARQRVLILIAENRDNGSGIKEREVLMEAEFANVPIYTVNISQLLASLTASVQPGRPSTLPPGAQPLPAGIVNTPTTESQNQMGNWVPVFKDVFDMAKSIFIPNPLTVYTKYTGGQEFSFKSQKTLQHDISTIGEVLHSQYWLTYIPNNQSEAGFHQIVVEVLKPNMQVRTRDGYWLAGQAQ